MYKLLNSTDPEYPPFFSNLIFVIVYPCIEDRDRSGAAKGPFVIELKKVIFTSYF
jgi:hypothetical protein